MHNSKTYVEYELNRLAEMKQQYLKRLEKLPEGRLKVSNAREYRYYFKVQNGDKVYLGSEGNDEVKKLKERRFLETSIQNMAYNQKLMEHFLQEYKPMYAEEVMASLPKTYQMDASLWHDEFIDAKKWSESKYDKSTYHPERLTHKTRKGDYVRSKSEAIIANILYDRRMYYHYEEKLQLGDKIIAPDFKIAVRSENKFKYLEHCGMMGNEMYAQNFTWKLQQYMTYGYLPWRDVFFTFDDMNGSIDTMAIHEMLENYFQ